jgi:hypothetical protein
MHHLFRSFVLFARNKTSIDGISRKGSQMALKHLSDRAEHIIDKAKSFGASLVGITHAVSLRNLPMSHAETRSNSKERYQSL